MRLKIAMWLLLKGAVVLGGVALTSAADGHEFLPVSTAVLLIESVHYSVYSGK